MQNQTIAATMIPTPAMHPITMPAMAPPDMEEPRSLEAAPVGDPFTGAVTVTTCPLLVWTDTLASPVGALLCRKGKSQWNCSAKSITLRARRTLIDADNNRYSTTPGKRKKTNEKEGKRKIIANG